MQNDDDIRDIFEAMILFLLVSELSKAPQYVCEYCMKSYKQESSYRSHIQQVHKKPIIFGGNNMNDSVDEIKQTSSSSVISVDVVNELLKQNRDMLDMIKQQQETICALLRHNKMMI
jgi:hypothetical protein